MMQKDYFYEILNQQDYLALWDWDIPGGQIRVNAQFANMLGYALENLDFAYDSMVSLLHPEDLESTRKQLDRCLEGQEPFFRSEHRIRRADGSYAWILSQGKVTQRDDGGRPLRMSGSHMDISDHRELEDDLSRERAVLTALLDSLPDAVFYKDPEGRYQGCNVKFERMTGKTLDDLQGRKASEIFEPELGRKLEEEDRLCMESGKVQSITLSHRYPNGETRLLEILRTTYRGPRGNILGIIGICHNITEYHHARQKAEAANQQLRQSIEHANRMARKAQIAGEAKSQFLANMSHEIRTPMNGIMGMADILLKSNLDEKQKRQAQTINKSAKNLMAVLNDILDFSKIEAGRFDLETIPFSFSSVVKDSLDLLAIDAHRKGLDLDWKQDSRLPAKLLGDPSRLRQIIINLLSNAIKFTHQGRIIIEATVLEDDQEDILLRTEIRDTGIGIDPERIPRLFDSFTQLDASTTRQYGGTGLGLAISKRLAEIMGGAIGVESLKGQGSIFWFTCRLKKCRGQAVTKTADQAEAENIPVAKTLAPGHAKILLAEDNEVNQEVVQEILDGEGMEVVSVINGREAVDVFSQKEFDLVLMDIHMPVMDGFDACKKIRESMRNAQQQVPIIALTARALKGDREECLKAGMDDYLAKPIDSARLISMVHKWLNRTAPPAEPETEIAAGPPEAKEAFESFDMDDLMNRCMHKKALVQKLMGKFLDILDKGLDALETSVREKDAEQIAFHAHSLKGSSGNLSAMKLMELCAGMEQKARNNEIDDMEARLESVKEEVEKYRKEAEAFMNM
ncbi:MAG: ATP-binding protein [Candidatus Sumerlaeia bacterium]